MSGSTVAGHKNVKGNPSAPCPLTPTLSLRERENRVPRLGDMITSGVGGRRSKVLSALNDSPGKRARQWPHLRGAGFALITEHNALWRPEAASGENEKVSPRDGYQEVSEFVRRRDKSLPLPEGEGWGEGEGGTRRACWLRVHRVSSPRFSTKLEPSSHGQAS